MACAVACVYAVVFLFFIVWFVRLPALIP